MSSHCTYDVCVIGAGVVGSSAAHYLASRGQKTLLLEQFPLPHWRGSSHGQTRIIRSSYFRPYYTKMVGDANKMWKTIEAKAQQELLIPNVGMFSVEAAPGEKLKEIVKSLVDAGEAFQVLSSEELKKRFPELSYPPHYTGVLEQSAGILKADKCLRVLQDQFIEFGGILKDGECVVDIQPGSPVTIKTTKSLLSAQKVILTAGPWTNNLLRPLGITLPLMPCKTMVLYWKTKQPGTYSLQSGFPSFYDCSASDGLCLYGLPSFEYPDMVKMTPDEDYVLDKHPRFANIVIGAGFSAHGFKLGPVSGKILAQLAMGETPSYDMSPFRIARFKTSSQHKASL